MEISGVLSVLHWRENEGQQHGIELESLQAAQMDIRCGEAVTGNADETRQSLFAGLDQGLQGATRSKCYIPVTRIDEVVQLDKVHAVDPQPLKGRLKLVLCFAEGPLAGLGGQEKVFSVDAHPRSDALLGFAIAVAGGGIDVVDAVLEEHIQGLVGLRLRRCPNGGSTEQTSRTSVPVLPNGGCSIITRSVATWGPDLTSMPTGAARRPPTCYP